MNRENQKKSLFESVLVLFSIAHTNDLSMFKAYILGPLFLTESDRDLEKCSLQNETYFYSSMKPPKTVLKNINLIT